jgi:Spy/CpxP family protein refolding chaperone
MTRAALIATLTLATALVAAGPVRADAPGVPPGGDGHHQRLRQALGLSDAQAQAIREIRARQRDAARQVRRALATAERELRGLALGGADDATVQAKIAEIEGLHGQALRLRVDALREIAPILSEEQKQTLGQRAPGHRRHRGHAPGARG